MLVPANLKSASIFYWVQLHSWKEASDTHALIFCPQVHNVSSSNSKKTINTMDWMS